MADKLTDAYQRALDGERQTFEQTHQGNHYRVTTLPVRGPDGEVTAGMAVSRDVTEAVERERELQRRNERLDQFASAVSHDLRNPLNVLDGSLALAAETGEQEHLDRCRRAVDRMERLVDNLLTLARQGEGVSDTDAVALASVAEDCWATVATADAMLAVETDLVVRADYDRFRQLFENLFRNAVEHSGPDVSVCVGALDEDGAGFYVADDGPGVPAEHRGEVFEAGFSTAADGTGFGLSIVADVAEAHGWSVGVTESASGGARFEVTGLERVA